jgi:xanthine/uracil permease
MRLHAIHITISPSEYAVQFCVYLVIVVIILRHAHLSHEIGTNVLCVALVAIAIGTALQALPKGPVGSGLLSTCAVLPILRRNRQRGVGRLGWIAKLPS